MDEYLSVAATLPADGYAGTLVGRVWLPGDPAGPAVVAIRDDGVFDLTPLVPTMSELCNAADPVALARSPEARRIGELAPILANSRWDRRDPALPWLLAPVDLQALKAAGVTFARSMLERVVEEQAKGDPSRAPAHPGADRGAWSAPICGAVRPGSDGGARGSRSTSSPRAPGRNISRSGSAPTPRSSPSRSPCRRSAMAPRSASMPISRWNNPEPELVLVVSAAGRIVGATLGNDVNLRDVEGRSALLLGKAKDNNASCSLGPFIRLVDAGFGARRDARGGRSS